MVLVRAEPLRRKERHGPSRDGEPKKGLAMISVMSFARQYVAARRLSMVYSANVLRRAAAIQVYANEQSLTRVFREPVVNGFLQSLPDRSPFTIRSYRSDILALWNAAADANLTPYPVMRRIHCPRVPALLIDCYTIDEVRLLLIAASVAAGYYPNGIAKRLYWSGAVRLAWDTGFRRGDVWAFRRDAVRPDGTLRIVQHKTQQVVTVGLRASTVAALDAIGGHLPLRWPLDPSFFGRHFRSLVKASGINRGTFKWLRRASGSYVEVSQPGAGYKHLGHANPQIFHRHYDAKLGGHTLPMPPPLD
jgi:integrase